MTNRSSVPRTSVIVAATLMMVAPLLAQQPPGPRYDSTTETKVTGTVEAVEQIQGSGGGGGGRGQKGMGGTHLMLKTSAETLNVHLGPTAYLNTQKVAIAKGDTLEIVGSRITVDGEQAFIAKSVKKGDTVWTLRDAAGLPLWRGGPK